jgi:hypothetical protein
MKKIFLSFVVAIYSISGSAQDNIIVITSTFTKTDLHAFDGRILQLNGKPVAAGNTPTTIWQGPPPAGPINHHKISNLVLDNSPDKIVITYQESY